MNAKTKRRYLALSLGLFLFSVYLFIYRGGFHSIDEVSMFAVTESLVKFGRFNTNQIAWTQWTTSQAEAQGFFGYDGHVYSKKGLALSLAQAPLYGLALLLPGLGMLQTVSLLNAFVTAATGLLVFMFVDRLGYCLRTATLVGVVLGLGSIVVVYAKYLFSEPLAGFLLLLAAYMLFAYRQEGGRRHIVIAGLAAGLAVLTRANNLFLLPIFGLYLLWLEYARINERLKEQKQTVSQPLFNRSTLATIGAFILALAIPGLIILSYNAIRSGNPLQTGYDLSLFSSNPLLGLYKLLLSPLRGLFIYSPILLLSLPGWWQFRRRYPAEAWLFAGLVGLTLALFSFWSSGEGLSWGSRFLVPVVPFFAISLAPIIEQVTGSRVANTITSYALRLTFYTLLSFSFFIQLLAVAINPWVFLAQMQTQFGGEFFLEKTAALYDFRYSQIAGQLQSWSRQNSDIVWWQPWGFDGPAFALALGLVLFSGWLLWRAVAGQESVQPPPAPLLLLLTIATIAVTYWLLVRYHQTDRQFGPVDNSYTKALERVAAQAGPRQPIITVAQHHYHIPMNRFKARVPLIGFAQQTPPLPDTALPLLAAASQNRQSWLVTVGFPPAAPNNAAERWLTLHGYKAGDVWLPDDVRLIQFATAPPSVSRAINMILGDEILLADVSLTPTTRAGQLVPVELNWRPVAAPPADYNLFLQLLNTQGALVAQHDNPPNGGYTPTSGWQVGRQITARHALSLPADLEPGHYRLITGLYQPDTGLRLTAESGTDFVELGNITIVEGQALKDPAP